MRQGGGAGSKGRLSLSQPAHHSQQPRLTRHKCWKAGWVWQLRTAPSLPAIPVQGEPAAPAVCLRRGPEFVSRQQAIDGVGQQSMGGPPVRIIRWQGGSSRRGRSARALQAGWALGPGPCRRRPQLRARAGGVGQPLLAAAPGVLQVATAAALGSWWGEEAAGGRDVFVFIREGGGGKSIGRAHPGAPLGSALIRWQPSRLAGWLAAGPCTRALAAGRSRRTPHTLDHPPGRLFTAWAQPSPCAGRQRPSEEEEPTRRGRADQKSRPARFGWQMDLHLCSQLPACRPPTLDLPPARRG